MMYMDISLQNYVVKDEHANLDKLISLDDKIIYVYDMVTIY